MKIIKRLDIFILRTYLLLFAGTFCISLFVVMMQFLWKYIDELVGKGLSIDVIVKFFYYAAITLVPMSLPLAVLLASLISFGNLGEKFELLAIKASGISLFRTLRSLIIFNSLIAILSFYILNDVSPKAQGELYKLRWSIMQSTPEVDIPEGAFYKGVPGLNMYVSHKNKENGHLYDVIIYNMRDGVNNAHIILSDSGKIEMSGDKKTMLLHLWNGEQFENITSNSGVEAHNVPYRRETFVNKTFLIDYDTNFKMADNDEIGKAATTMSISRILLAIDSLTAYYDSVSVSFYNDMAVRTFYVANTSEAKVYPNGIIQTGYAGMPGVVDINPSDSTAAKADSTNKAADAEKVEKIEIHLAKIPEMVHLQQGVEINHKQHVNLDTLYAHLSSSDKQNAIVGAMQRVNIASMDLDYKKTVMDDGDDKLRGHWSTIWQKITMALTCIIFFFIGAPLGAIIRKGGLGMPVVIAVLIFILYYIINTGGMRSGEQGTIPVWFGLWLSTMILTPLAIFLTIKSNNDSVMFNREAYTNFFRRLTGKRIKRHLPRKEVIINDPDYPETLALTQELLANAEAYRASTHHASPFGYIRYMYQHFVSRRKDEEAERISILLEHIVDILSNTKDRKVLIYINSLPVLETSSFRFYRRRRGDMKNILEYGGHLQERIKEIIYEHSTIQ